MYLIKFNSELTATEILRPIEDACQDVAEKFGHFAIIEERDDKIAPIFLDFTDNKSPIKIGRGPNSALALYVEPARGSYKTNFTKAGVLFVRSVLGNYQEYGGFTNHLPGEAAQKYGAIALISPSELDVNANTTVDLPTAILHEYIGAISTKFAQDESA